MHDVPSRSEPPDDLFEAALRERMAERAPLAARMGPATIDDIVGQPDGTWIEHDRDRIRKDGDILLSARNQLVRDRDDLQRKVNGAPADISRLAVRRVTELFPDGGGKTMPS